MQATRRFSTIATALCGVALSSSADISWRSDVPDGYYHVPANWVGNIIPTNTTAGYFTGNTNYVIRFPAGGYVENSVTKVGGLSSGRSLVFDTTGTWWLKSAPSITNGWPNSWTGFQIMNGANSHLFNLEGLVTVAAATNYPIMLMSNAVYRYTYFSNAATNTFEQGLFNIYDPGGKVYGGHALITGSATPRSVIVFKEGSALRANEIRMRGTQLGHFLRFEGGTHEIFNGLRIGEGATGAGTTNMVQLSAGNVYVRGGTVQPGSGKSGSYGLLLIDGTGAMEIKNGLTIANNATNLAGAVQLREAGRLTVGGEGRLGETARTYSALTLNNSASATLGGLLNVAYASLATSLVDVADSAALTVTGATSIPCKSGAAGTITLRNSAAATSGSLSIGYGNAGGQALVTVRDTASLTTTGAVSVADNATGIGRLELLGGTLRAQSVQGGAGAQLRGGTGWAELYANGGLIGANNITSTKSLVEKFDKAELGAAGLTLDSSGFDITVNQTFADAAGAAGLVLKTGAGTLSASNSAHAVTVIAQGTLRLLSASAAFGRSLAVTNQAGLSLSGAATNLTVGDLTLGAPGALTPLYLDAGDRITVTNSAGLTLPLCGLSFGAASANGTYTLFRCAGSLSPSVLSNLSMLNPAPGKDYVFAVVPDGADSAVQLTIADFTVRQAVWNGSQSAEWSTAENWTPAASPVNGTHTFFTDSGAQKSVTLSAPSACAYVNFASATPYLLQGATLSLPAGGISNSLGAHTLAVPLALAGSFAVQAAQATTTTVSGALSASAGMLFSKSGPGTLAVSGDNASFNGLWLSVSGRLHFASAAAAGAANAATNAITLGAGTLTYSGAPTTLTKGLTLSAGSLSNAVIFDTRSDLAFNAPLSLQPSLLCKRGAGALTLHVGSGTTALSVGAGSGNVNITPNGTIVLPDSGDAPATPTGLGGFNVLEGTFRVKGNGAAASTVNQQHFGIIGGQFSPCAANPVLELDGVRMNQGTAGQHLLLGNQMSASSPGLAPTLRLLNGAYVALDHLRMGVSPATTFSPTLVLSNATISASWQLSIGADNSTFPVVRLAQGSAAIATGGNQWGGGVLLYRNVDILVTDNSVLSSTAVDGLNFRFADSAASGVMRFESGGTMRFARFLGLNYLTAAGLNVFFNGGVMEPVASGDSISTAFDKQSFILEAGGLTLNTPSGVRHAFHFPFTGAGGLTKTGPGEAVFAQGWSYAPTGTNLSGLATASYTGGTTVQQGILSVSNGTIRADAAVLVAAGAALNLSAGAVALGEVSGLGTVSNGVLSADYRCRVSGSGNDCLAFADVALPAGGLTVAFDIASGSALTNRQTLAVATLSGTTDLHLAQWRARNVGDKMTASFSLVGNTVFATARFTGGTLITVR